MALDLSDCMKSFLQRNEQWLECRLFYPAPLYHNFQTFDVGGTAELIHEAFYQYDTKLVFPRHTALGDGIFEVIHHGKRFLFLAGDTFPRADRTIYGTLITLPTAISTHLPDSLRQQLALL